MTQIQNDQELLELFKDPSTKEHAFTAIIKKYQEKLYWHIRRIVVDHDDANDVLQNVLIRVWKGLETHDPPRRTRCGLILAARGASG